jgi:hypothetical protein
MLHVMLELVWIGCGVVDTELKAPDVMVLGPEWPERALLRAQLIEEGLEVVAIDVWPMPRLYRRRGMTPRVMIVDLRGLPEPRNTLEELGVVFPPDRVLVVTALGTVDADDVRRFGFHVIERPATIGQITRAAAAIHSTHTIGHAS